VLAQHLTQITCLEKIFPFISKTLERLTIGMISHRDYRLAVAKVLETHHMPRVTVIEFRRGPGAGHGNVPPILEPEKMEWSKVFFNQLPSLKELVAPDEDDHLGHFLSTVVDAMPTVPDVCVRPYGNITHSLGAIVLQYSSHFGSSMCSAFKFYFMAKSNYSLKKTWLLDESHLVVVGGIRITCMSLLHFLVASKSHVTVDNVVLNFEKEGEDAVNLRRIGENSFGVTPFHAAIGANRIDMVRLLLEKFKPDLAVPCFEELHPLGYNALELACVLQLVDIVELLLSSRSAYYLQYTTSEALLRLYLLAQRGLCKEASVTWWKSFEKYPPEDVPVERKLQTIAALDSFFGSAFPLARLRDPITGSTVLHTVFIVEAAILFGALGADPAVVDTEGRPPLDSAVNAVTAGKLEGNVLIAIAKLDKSMPEPRTPRIRQLLLGFALVRQKKPAVIDQDPDALDLESKIWEIAAKEDIEQGYHFAKDEMFLAKILVDHLGTKRPFFSIMQQKKCRFPWSFGSIVEKWLIDAVLPSRPERAGMTKADQLRCSSYILGEMPDVMGANCYSVETLHHICRPLWSAPDSVEQSEEIVALLEALNIVVEQYASRKDPRPLLLTCQTVPCSIPWAQSRKVRDKILNAASALAPEDVDWSETLRAVVRIRHSVPLTLHLLTFLSFCRAPSLDEDNMKPQIAENHLLPFRWPLLRHLNQLQQRLGWYGK
jgi:hypothetical protein